MAAYVFNAKSDASGGIFSAGDAIISFGGSDMAIITDVQISVSRNLTPLPTLNKGLFYTSQYAQGTLSCGCIITKSSNIVKAFKMQGTESCDPLSFNVAFGANGCKTGGEVNISIVDGYADSISFTANGQQGYISGNVVVRFSQCQISSK